MALISGLGALPASYSRSPTCSFARSWCCDWSSLAHPTVLKSSLAVDRSPASSGRPHRELNGTTRAQADDVQQPTRPEPLQAQPPPARPPLGGLLLHQPRNPQRPSLGPVLLQQAPLPPTCTTPAQQQQQQQQQPRPQLCQRSLQPMQPEMLAAVGGVPVRKLERYMCQEAAEFRGMSWPAPHAAAPSKGPATTAAGAAMALLREWSTFSRTHSNPRLVVAAKSLLLDPPTAAVDESAVVQQQQQQPQHTAQAPARRRRRTSSTSSSGSSSGPSSHQQHGSSRVAGQPRTTGAAATSTGASRAGHMVAAGFQQHQRQLQPSLVTRSFGTSSATPHPPGTSGSSDTASSSSSQHSSQHIAPVALPDAQLLSDEEVLLQLQESLKQQHGIQLEQLSFGQHRLLCPHCSGGSQQEQSLSISLPEEQPGTAVWCCHRATCAWTGRFSLPRVGGRQQRRAAGGSSGSWTSSSRSSSIEPQQQFTPTPVPAAAASQLQPLTAELLSYLQVQRCISPAVLVRNRVMSCPHSTGTTTTCSSGSGGSTSGSSSSSSIAFPYFFQGDVLVNIKYRSLDKRFHQVKGGQQVFYGVNDLQDATEAIIVEGEMDKLALETATGLTAVLSLPSGALPATAAARTRRDSKKLACVDAAAQQLSQLQRITIAVDGDAPGWATALALHDKLLTLAQRHAGQQQQQGCVAASQQQQVLYLAWPAAKLGGQAALHKAAELAAAAGLQVDAAAAAQCKDANDLLMRCGPDFLRLYLQVAPLPMHS